MRKCVIVTFCKVISAAFKSTGLPMWGVWPFKVFTFLALSYCPTIMPIGIFFWVAAHHLQLWWQCLCLYLISDHSNNIIKDIMLNRPRPQAPINMTCRLIYFRSWSILPPDNVHQFWWNSIHWVLWYFWPPYGLCSKSIPQDGLKICNKSYEELLPLLGLNPYDYE